MNEPRPVGDRIFHLYQELAQLIGQAPDVPFLREWHGKIGRDIEYLSLGAINPNGLVVLELGIVVCHRMFGTTFDKAGLKFVTVYERNADKTTLRLASMVICYESQVEAFSATLTQQYDPELFMVAVEEEPPAFDIANLGAPGALN